MHPSRQYLCLLFETLKFRIAYAHVPVARRPKFVLSLGDNFILMGQVSKLIWLFFLCCVTPTLLYYYL